MPTRMQYGWTGVAYHSSRARSRAVLANISASTRWRAAATSAVAANDAAAAGSSTTSVSSRSTAARASRTDPNQVARR